MSSYLQPEQRTDFVRILLFFIFAFIIISNLLYWLPKDIKSNGIDIWVYTDWLIDYSSGFVRRGLSGEIINLFLPYFHPRTIIGMLTWLIYILFLAGYVRLILKSFRKMSLITFTGVLFLPSLPLFYIYDHDAFGRTESIGFLILLCHLYLAENYLETGTKQYIRRVLPVTLVALPAHIFIHESSFFLFIPAHLLISHTIIRYKHTIASHRALILLLLIYLPVIASIASIIFFGRPSLETAAEICRHWEQAGALKNGACVITDRNPSWALPGSFAALSWDFSQAITLPMSLSVVSLGKWASIFLVLGIYTSYIGSRLVSELTQKHAVENQNIPDFQDRLPRFIGIKYFLIPLILSTPLYILGWDYGRWFSVISINYMLILMSEKIVFTEQVNLSAIKKENIIRQAGVKFSENKNVIYLASCFFLALIIIFLRLPHCCIDTNMFSESVRGLIK